MSDAVQELANELRKAWLKEDEHRDGDWQRSWMAVARLVLRREVEEQREAFCDGAMHRSANATVPHDSATPECTACLAVRREAERRYPFPPVREAGMIEPLRVVHGPEWCNAEREIATKLNETIASLNDLRASREGR